MERYLTYKKNSNLEKCYRFRELMNIVHEVISLKKIKQITFVDIGSGDGQFMKYVRTECPIEINFRFIGIDKYVTDKSFDFELNNNDIEKGINLPDNSADIILAGEIIEHIKDTDFFIQEVYRVLKKDGDFIITTPNLAGYMNRLLLLFGYQPYHAEVSNIESGFGNDIIAKILGRSKYGNKTAGHLRVFTYRALVDFVNYYGFRIEKYYPVYYSGYREDNKRIFIIKIIFFIDSILSKIFPKMANGMIFHLKIKEN